MKLKKTVHYYKFRDIMENPLLQEKLLNKKTVAGVLSTISRYSTITRYTIMRVDCINKVEIPISISMIYTMKGSELEKRI